MVALVDARSHSKHIKMTRCDIKPRSVERSKDIGNEKKSKGIYSQIRFLKHHDVFCMVLKTFWRHNL
jgi:hypothetical protein